MISGTVEFSKPIEEVFGKLSDINFLVNCIPDLESAKIISPVEAACTIRPGFSFINGTLDTTISLGSGGRCAGWSPDKDGKNTLPDYVLDVRLFSKGIGSSSETKIALEFRENEGKTKIDWRVDVEKLTGLLCMAPKGLVQAAAQKVVEMAWEKIRKEI